ncbi:DUF4124 domain-containing protein [Variovorax sp. PAMC 28711]|uniref:DUF4124 domain-containing protein n=1 Tax=Variovorax sp. PAMC 28711 TaxID=1795631 RepID=UPI00078D8952|nr:DUF4124 domain-containing protein [Variovorax sp. PAMC 28711]AMM26307.1 hypothetical protein AX767_19570 [Variovorax sp. PAMC 28711]
MKFMRLPTLVLGLVCVLPLAAHAQWQWVDNAGKKVFSDQAPPPDIPEKNIVRRAGGASSRPALAPVTPPSDAVAGTPLAAPARSASGAVRPSGVDKELEEKTKRAEDAEKARQAAEAQKLAQAKAENCNRARQSKATYDSGIRVARLNDKGEREIMDDKARAEEQQRLQTVISGDCK